MADIARQRRHQSFIVEINEANHAALLRLEHIWVIFYAEERTDHATSRIHCIELILPILVENPGEIGCTTHGYSQEKETYEGREDTKDDDYFIVQLEQISVHSLASLLMRRLSYGQYIEDGPNSVGDIIERIEEEYAILHANVVGVSKFKVCD